MRKHTDQNTTTEARSVSVFEGAIRVTLRTGRESTGGCFSFYEITCEPGSGPPLHVHSDVDETFYVLEGAFQFQIGETRLHAAPGWSGQGPRHVPHGFTACGSTPARMLMIVSPAGLEDFFLELSRLTSTRAADPAEVTALFEKHGMTIVGPQVELASLEPASGFEPLTC